MPNTRSATQANIYSRPKHASQQQPTTASAGDANVSSLQVDWLKYYQNERKTSKIKQTSGEYSEIQQLTDRAVLARFGYVIGKTLGTGRYSKVKIAQDHHSGRGTVAVKMVDKRKVKASYIDQFLPREVQVWQAIQHQNVVRLYQCIRYRNMVFMVNEYCPGGDLLTYVQQTGAQKEQIAKLWLSQLLNVVLYLHGKQTAHRDLKLENIMLDENKNLKVADFGFARHVDPDYLSRTFCGSKAYSSPEILQSVPYCPYKADMWSVGVIAYILLTGRMPFNEDVPTVKIIVETQKNCRYQQTDRYLRLASYARSFINNLLTFEWHQRPNAAESAQHKWIKSVMSPEGTRALQLCLD